MSKELCVGHLPGRKSPAFFVQDGSVCRILAYFRNEKALDEFKQLCDGRRSLFFLDDPIDREEMER